MRRRGIVKEASLWREMRGKGGLITEKLKVEEGEASSPLGHLHQGELHLAAPGTLLVVGPVGQASAGNEVERRRRCEGDEEERRRRGTCAPPAPPPGSPPARSRGW